MGIYNIYIYIQLKNHYDFIIFIGCSFDYRFIAGNCNTTAALESARNELLNPYNGDRSQVANYIFLIIGSPSINQRSSLQMASALHRDGVTIFAIGGGAALESEVSRLSSPPHRSDYNYFMLQSFEQLSGTVDIMLSYAVSFTAPQPQPLPPIQREFLSILHIRILNIKVLCLLAEIELYG